MYSISEHLSQDFYFVNSVKETPKNLPDMICPQIPDFGRSNFWSASCAMKTQKGGACYRNGCATGDRFRTEKSAPAKKVSRRAIPCMKCGGDIDRYYGWKRIREADGPTCKKCCDALAKARRSAMMTKRNTERRLRRKAESLKRDIDRLSRELESITDAV